MSKLSENIKVQQVSKTLFNNYDIIEFENSFKKIKNKMVNYELTVNAICNRSSLEDLFVWFNKELEGGVKTFTGEFEIVRDTETHEDFEYSFLNVPDYIHLQNDLVSLTFNLVRIVQICEFDYLNIISILLNIQKNLNLTNTSVEANVSCPLQYQILGAALSNIANSVELHSNDFRYSKSFY